MKITVEETKITKPVQCELFFIFIELLETLNIFVKIRVAIDKKRANFIKACFYCNDGYIKTRKHVETFKANKGCKLGIIIFITTSLFSKLKFKVHFSNVIFTKTRRCTFLFFIWKRITLALSFIWLKNLALLLVLEVRFFELVFFFSQVQGLCPGPDFRRCCLFIKTS